MFDSDVSRGEEPKTLTRRVFLAGGATIAGGIAMFSLRGGRMVEASGATHGTPGEVIIVEFSDDGKQLGKQTVAKVVKTDAAWREQLGANSFGSPDRRTRRCRIRG